MWENGLNNYLDNTDDVDKLVNYLQTIDPFLLTFTGIVAFLMTTQYRTRIKAPKKVILLE